MSILRCSHSNTGNLLGWCSGWGNWQSCSYIHIYTAKGSVTYPNRPPVVCSNPNYRILLSHLAKLLKKFKKKQTKKIVVQFKVQNCILFFFHLFKITTVYEALELSPKEWGSDIVHCIQQGFFCSNVE